MAVRPATAEAATPARATDPGRRTSVSAEGRDVAVVDTGDVRVATFVEGEGPALVVLPSYGRDGAGDYDEFSAPVAGAGWKVLRPPPRGVAGSTGPMQGADLSALARDVSAVIRRLARGRAVVLGHAFGNQVARALGTEHGDLVSAVVLAMASARHVAADVNETPFVAGDPSRPEAERLAALGRAFFAPGHDARAWLSGWYPETLAMQRAAVKASDMESFWASGTAPVLEINARHLRRRWCRPSLRLHGRDRCDRDGRGRPRPPRPASHPPMRLALGAPGREQVAERTDARHRPEHRRHRLAAGLRRIVRFDPGEPGGRAPRLRRNAARTPPARTSASRQAAPPPRRTPAIDTLSNATHSGDVAAQPRPAWPAPARRAGRRRRTGRPSVVAAPAASSARPPRPSRFSRPSPSSFACTKGMPSAHRSAPIASTSASGSNVLNMNRIQPAALALQRRHHRPDLVREERHNHADRTETLRSRLVRQLGPSSGSHRSRRCRRRGTTAAAASSLAARSP